jgi:peptide chain release factor
MKFPVSKAKEDALFHRLAELGIREADLEEHFVRSQGPGGQNVNKTSTCVILSHKPTGVQVRCQDERSQGLNRFLARRRLAEKIAQKVLQIKTAEDQKRFRIRRQKKRRSRRMKEKLRRHKEIRSEAKRMRSRIREDSEV